MPFLSYERVEATDNVQDVDALTVPANATLVDVQADTNDVRYTMDGDTDPDQAVGMIIHTDEPARSFLVEDLNRIRFHRGAATNGWLNLHYYSGRDV